MILKTLYLKIGDTNRDGLMPVDFTYGFLKRSRCLCNYLEREVLKALKFRSEGFNRIVISVCTKPAEEFEINSCQVACVEIPFNRKEYESKSDEALMHYYAECLSRGLKLCAQSVSIPLDELLAGINSFMAGGMKNEWVYKSRTFREHQLKTSLLCSLSPEKFKLKLQIWRAKELIFDKVILRTDPDEIAFEHRFRNVDVVDGVLTITSRLGKVLWSAKVDAL